MTPLTLKSVCGQALVWAWALSAVPALSADAQSQPAELPWGTAKLGVSLSLTVPGDISAGGAMAIRVALRNTGAGAVNLPGAKDAFGWVQLYYDRDTAWVTAKVFPAGKLADGVWPAKLASGQVIRFAEIDLGSIGVYGKSKHKELYTAFLDTTGKSAAPAEDGKLTSKLLPGSAKARFVLCLPQPGAKPLVLMSNVVDVEVAAGDFASLSAEARKAQADKLIAKFDKDAWAASAAHASAVKIGPGIVPYLAAALKDAKHPDFSRMWMVTSVADIPCAASVDALIDLLQGADGGIRSVVGYYGPKQHSEKLDQAILDSVCKEENRGAVAYTLLGFLIHRKEIPPRLMAVSLESKDPKVRSAVIEAFKGQASDANLAALSRLVGDSNERVRSAAAKALGGMGRGGPEVVAALVRSLQAQGEQARASIAEALGKLTGTSMPYNPKADEQAKQKVLAFWKDWLVKQPKGK